MNAAELARGFLTQPPGDDPYPFYRRLREVAPIVNVGGFTLLSRYQECYEVLRDTSFRTLDTEYRDRVMPWWRQSPGLRLLTENLVFTNPPKHDPIRRVISGVFTQRRVAEMRVMVRDRVGYLVSRLAELGRDGAIVDFVGEFADALPINVVADLLGIPEEDRHWFRPLVGDLTRALDPFWTKGQLSAADRAAETLTPYCRDLAERRSTGGDIIGALAELHRARPEILSMDALVCNVALLLVASYETTSALLGSGLQTLFERPVLREKLREDPTLAADYVEEMLRYEAPTQVVARWMPADTVVGGVTIPAGNQIVLLLGAANRDPGRFSDPDTFDPARPDNQPLSFGSGAHFCAGAALARLEAREAFRALLTRLPDLRPAGPAVHRLRRSIRSYETLPVHTTAPGDGRSSV
jgi:cytochrome P450